MGSRISTGNVKTAQILSWSSCVAFQYLGHHIEPGHIYVQRGWLMQYVPRTVTRSSQMQRDDDASRCGIRSRRSRWMRWDEDASWCRHLLSRRSDAVKWSGAQVRSRDLQFLSRQARQSHSINLVTLILTAWPSGLLQALIIIIIIIKVVLRLESAMIEMFWFFFLPTLA